MPNPMFLKVMGITVHEYNSYSPAKKGRFQKKAQQKVNELHQGDIDAYIKLTQQTEAQVARDAQEVVEAEEFDKEND